MVLAVLGWGDAEARRRGGELLVERADADDAAATRIVVAYVGNGAAPDHLLEDDWARVVFGAIANASRKATMEHAVQRWLEQLDGMGRARQVIRAEEELGLDVLLARLERDPRRRPAVTLLGELRNSRATEPLVGAAAGGPPPGPRGRRAGARADPGPARGHRAAAGLRRPRLRRARRGAARPRRAGDRRRGVERRRGRAGRARGRGPAASRPKRAGACSARPIRRPEGGRCRGAAGRRSGRRWPTTPSGRC